jgi:hypothetical protein
VMRKNERVNAERRMFLFVTGVHRSGTTPLYRCLRDHPQISGFQNTGVSEDEGQHLQTVLPRGGAFGGPGRFGHHPGSHMTEADPSARSETAADLFQQWQGHWDLSKAVLAEKSPPTLLRTRLFQALFPNSRFLVIVRHPAAVALASLKGVSGLSPAALIEHWLVCHEIFLADAAHLREVQVVKYEQFVAAPRETLNAIYAWLCLQPHTGSEEVRTALNEAYAQQWQALSEASPSSEAVAAALCLEERVRRFGYSLRNWKVCEPFPEAPNIGPGKLRTTTTAS